MDSCPHCNSSLEARELPGFLVRCTCPGCGFEQMLHYTPAVPTGPIPDDTSRYRLAITFDGAPSFFVLRGLGEVLGLNPKEVSELIAGRARWELEDLPGEQMARLASRAASLGLEVETEA